MDPEARMQVTTMGTALYFKKDSTDFIGVNGEYSAAALKTALADYTRVRGLASTPDFGGQPNTIDSTTLDNTVAETSQLGLMPATEISYEINVMTLAQADNNLRAVKAMSDATPKTEAHWVLVKSSGVIVEYNGTSTISYTADGQSAIEKFSIYHNTNGDIRVSLPAVSV